MRRAIVLLIVPLMCGCGEDGPAAESRGPDSAVVSKSAMAGWNAQVARVRAGKSRKIRIGHARAGEVDWSDLSVDCGELRSLWIEGAMPNDDVLDRLASFENFEALALTAPIDDDELARIADCAKLKRLNLPNSRVSGAGFAAIARLGNLEQLRIGSSSLTDAGLKAIKELPRLRFLHLIDVPITDAGLETVAAVETLESFYLDGGRTTRKGLRAFLAARPDVHFHKDQLHLPGDPNAHRH